jgi:HEAT repeat protein
MMHNLKMRYVLFAALLAALACPAAAQEAKLIAVLRSDATVQEKAAACRQLVRVGTKQSVPALAALLGDEKLSHMARYALEPIRDPSVDDALREALAKVPGRPRLGVIGSLGVRRDAKAVEPLAALLKGADADVAQAAARALGNIGTAEAQKALEGALTSAPAGTQPAVCEGLLRCAEALRSASAAEHSQKIYDTLRGLATAPPHVRVAGLRGAMLVRGKDAVPLLVEALRGSDYAMAAAGIRASMELPGKEITDALTAELPKVAAERKGLLILALAGRGDARVMPAVLQAAQGDDAQLRVLALRALKRVGDASCLPALLDVAAGDNADVAQAALDAIQSLPAKEVDEQIAQRLTKAEGKARLVLLELARRRHSTAAAPALWLAADDKDPAVRAAALAGLGAVIDAADLPKLIARLADTKNEQESAALDKALREACLRVPDREAVAAKIVEGLPAARGLLKARLLETLGSVGGTKALEAVVAAAKASDAELRDVAFRVLGQWPSADAAPVLLELHNTVSDERLKVRAVRAYIRIARQFDIPADRRADMCRKALAAAQRDDDKRLVLEVLLRYPSDQMRAIAEEAAKVPALKDEAMIVLLGMASGKGVNRAELGRALAQAGHKPVKLEIIKAEYGAGAKTKDVTAVLRRHAKSFRVIFLPNENYNESFGGDPAEGTAKQLKVKYRIDGKEGEVLLNENATVVLPMPK